jgi:phytoene synthase
MQDAFAYCAELVRTADRDRFIASLFAPPERRAALQALYAFNVEVARVSEVVREALPGEIRLQWWCEAIEGGRAEEAAANPVAAASLAVIARYRLPASSLVGLIDAHRADLYDEPMAQMADLETYARNTGSALIVLAAQILGGTETEIATAANAAGVASTIASLLHDLPLHAARRRLCVPLEILERHGVPPEDVFAGRSSDGLRAALAELRDVARGHLATLQRQIRLVPEAAVPAFLPVALVRPSLDRLERSDPFAPVGIAPWRRQWLIWRAARNPTRIAG